MIPLVAIPLAISFEHIVGAGILSLGGLLCLAGIIAAWRRP